MHEPRIDLSSLDPSRDSERWQKLVQSLADRAFAKRQQQLTIGYQMAAWARPVLAVAAAVTLAFGANVWLNHERRSALTLRPVEPAFVLATWAAADERPATSNILQVLGEYNATE